jgi:HSP90 family molecular chaperone
MARKPTKAANQTAPRTTKPLYTVTLPGPHRGTEVYYGVQFIDGVAVNVPEGFGLDEFKDWRDTTVTLQMTSKEAEKAAAEAEAAEAAAQEAASEAAADSVEDAKTVVDEAAADGGISAEEAADIKDAIEDVAEKAEAAAE